MARGGKVHHWKHGWIPLDAAALKNKEHHGPPPRGSAKGGHLTNDDRLKITGMARAERHAQFRHVDKVDGVDFVAYKSIDADPMHGEHGKPARFDEAQEQVVADAYNKIKARWPGIQPVQFVAVDNRQAFGVTSWDGRRISLSTFTFSDKGRQMAHQNYGEHGAIAGQYTDDPASFASAVVAHEMGHALQMQDPRAKRAGKRLANERVTAEEVGIKIPEGADPTLTAPRWGVDTLNKQSVYGTTNEYEFFAEAFADGYLHGDKATPEGQTAVTFMDAVYGKGGSVR